MNLSLILEEYEQLTAECREVIETEISRYRAGQGGRDPSVHEIKEGLIERLGTLLDQLRGARLSLAGLPATERARVNFLQQRFMQILRLDRELEKLILADNVTQRLEAVPQPESPLFAARLYRHHGSR